MPTADAYAKMTPEQKERAREANRKWRAANLEKKRAANRKWRAANPCDVGGGRPHVET